MLPGGAQTAPNGATRPPGGRFPAVVSATSELSQLRIPGNDTTVSHPLPIYFQGKSAFSKGEAKRCHNVNACVQGINAMVESSKV